MSGRLVSSRFLGEELVGFPRLAPACESHPIAALGPPAAAPIAPAASINPRGSLRVRAAPPHAAERTAPRPSPPPLPSPQIGRRLLCGNFGLIVAQAWAQCTDVNAILEAQIDITSGRGGQSGGIAHYFPTPSGNTGMRVRVRPGRRQIISRQLASALAVRLRLAKAARALTFRSFTPPADGPVDHVQVFQGHTRFATSSMPSVPESHPHQWSPESRVSMWRVDPATGKAARRAEPFSVYVTHNGDFDLLNVYGRDRTHREIAEWLTVILHSPCPARCDSVKVAGVIELFRTQGVWAHAFRFAFLTTLATHFEDTLSDGALGAAARPGAREERPGDALRREYTTVAKTNAVAALAEQCFAGFCDTLPPLPNVRRRHPRPSAPSAWLLPRSPCRLPRRLLTSSPIPLRRRRRRSSARGASPASSRGARRSSSTASLRRVEPHGALHLFPL